MSPFGWLDCRSMRSRFRSDDGGLESSQPNLFLAVDLDLPFGGDYFCVWPGKDQGFVVVIKPSHLERWPTARLNFEDECTTCMRSAFSAGPHQQPIPHSSVH